MSGFVHGLAGLARRAPATTLVVLLVLTVLFGVFTSQAEQDQSQEAFSPDNPRLEASEFAGEAFASEGGETVVQVVVEGTDELDVISPEGFETAQAIRTAVTDAIPADQLGSGDGGGPVVTWLAPVEGAIAAGFVPAESLSSEDGADMVYTQVMANVPDEAKGLTEGLVASDGEPTEAHAALALVFLDTEAVTAGAADDTARSEALVAGVQQVVDAVDTVEAPLDVSAFAFELFLAPDDSFEAEIGRLFATAALIIIVILFFVYLFPPRGGVSRLKTLRRAAADVGLTLFVILATIVWMQGIGVLLGPDYAGIIGAFSPPTQIIPILLIGLGVDYGIHLTSRYRHELSEGATIDRAVERASTTVGVALLLATMTTALGFLTNATNPVPAIKDFGILAAVGIVVAFLLMLTFLPSARILLDRRAANAETLPREALGASSEGRLSRLTASTAVLAERFPWAVLATTLVLGGVGAYGLTQLSTEFSFTDFVPEGNPIVETFETVEEEFGGGFGEQTQVVVQGDVATPEAHNAVVAGLGELGAVEGVLTIGDQPAADSVPARIGQQFQLASGETGGFAADTEPPDPEAVAAAEEFVGQATSAGLQQDLTVSGDADVDAIYDALGQVDPALGSVLAEDRQATQVIVQTQSSEVGALELADDVEASFDDLEGTGAAVTATSTAIISDAIVSDLSSSQIQSLIWTLVAALVLLMAVFGIRDRRPLLGAITLFPVGLVVLWVFGTMAATGIPFGPVTSTISGLAIGIGVPFTIHITNRFLEDVEIEPDVGRALHLTLRHTGGALAGSALTTMAGFAILVSSSLVPFRQLGQVVAYAIGFSLLSSILVLPSLLALWARWRLDEGRALESDKTIAAMQR